MKNQVLIGDIHSQADPLRKALSYCRDNDRVPVLLGDLFDSRCDSSDSVGVYNAVRQAQSEMGAIVLRSNHQDKLERFLNGNSAKILPEMERTIHDFVEAEVKSDELLNWLESLPYGFCFKQNDREYRCAHAFFPSWFEVPEYEHYHTVWTMTNKARQLAMYGPVNHQDRDSVMGNRVQWWLSESDRKWVRVAGHYHVVHQDNRSLVLDGGCGDKKRSWFCDEPAALMLYDVAKGEMIKFDA